MEALQQLVIAMLVRVWDFLRAHPFGDEPGTALTEKYWAALARVRELIGQEQEGRIMRKVQVARHVQLRQRITRVPVRHLARIAEGLPPEQAQLAAMLRLDRTERSRPEFLAKVRSILAAAEANAELLKGVGMAEGTVTDLRTLTDAYEQAMSDADAGRRAHIGARAERHALLRELRRMTRQLDGIISYRYQGNAEMLATWASARNTAWPVAVPPKPELPKPAEGRPA